MVDFVDAFVKVGEVQQAMDEVEYDFAEEPAEEEVGCEFGQGGEGGGDLEAGGEVEGCGEEAEEEADEGVLGLVAEDDEEAVADFGGGGLFLRGLEFVGCCELGREGVEGCVEEGGDPEEEELDEEGSVEFDVLRGVGGYEGCPAVLEGVHFAGWWWFDDGLVWYEVEARITVVAC